MENGGEKDNGYIWEKEQMKRLVSCGLSLLLCLSPMISEASGIVDANKYEIHLGKGLEFRKETAFYEWGVQSLNVLEMDYTDPDLELDLLYNKNGFSQRLSLSAMMSQRPEMIAGINGDFFSMSTPGFSIGPMMKEGKPLSNAHYTINKFASMMVDDSGVPSMAYVRPGVTVHNHAKGVITNVNSINKPSPNYANIVALTKEYMQNSPGASKKFFDLTEVVIDSGVVREVRFGQPSVAVPDNGYVLVAGGANSYLLSGNFAVGDQVEMKTDLSIAYPSAKMAIGGGSMLIKGGKALPITHQVKGKSQRSAIAITKDDKIWFVTVDGRKEPYIGMDEKDMQAYLLAKGVREALMLDGGGSTEMIVDGKIQNHLSGKERPLVNGIGIRAKSPVGPVDSIEVNLLSNLIFEGDRVELMVRAKDASGRPISLSTSQFQIRVNGLNASFDGNGLMIHSAGMGTVEASYGGVTGTKEIEVLSTNRTDDRYMKPGEDRPMLSVIPDMTSQDVSLMDEAVKAKMQTILSESPAIITMSNKDSVFEKGISTFKEAFNGAFKTKKAGVTAFISVDNRSGGVYKVKGQWDYFRKLLNSESKNIVILLQGNEEAAALLDRKAFDKAIQEAAKNKNIYVVYKSSVFSSKKRGEASYISIADYARLEKRSLTDLQCLVFYDTSEGLKYGFKQLFE